MKPIPLEFIGLPEEAINQLLEAERIRTEQNERARLARQSERFNIAVQKLVSLGVAEHQAKACLVAIWHGVVPHFKSEI
jgi:hypothetical protein